MLEPGVQIAGRGGEASKSQVLRSGSLREPGGAELLECRVRMIVCLLLVVYGVRALPFIAAREGYMTCVSYTSCYYGGMVSHVATPGILEKSCSVWPPPPG